MNTPRQTNLLGPTLAPKKIFLSAQRMTVVIAAGLAAILLTWAGLGWLLSDREARLLLVKQTISSQREQLSKVSPEVSNEQQKLLKELASLDSQIKSSRALLSVIGQANPVQWIDRGTRHDDLLEAVAQFESKSLWLYKLEFDPNTQLMALAGKTTNPGEVANYAGFLASHKSFSGMVFDQLDIHLDPANPSLWVFVIGAQKSSAYPAKANTGQTK